MSLSKSIGTNIRAIRTQKKISQEDLASTLYVTRQTISNYETGRSNPDLDMLHQISVALDVDILCLIYGLPISPEKNASKKQTITLSIITCALFLVTLILYAYANYLKSKYIVMPSVFIRLVLIPLNMTFLGTTALQIIDYFFGIRNPKDKIQKTGKIITASVLTTNSLFTLPYIIWCLYITIQSMLRNDIASIFPSIPVYKDIAFFFLSIMYNSPSVYILVGMAIGIFYYKKKGHKSQ